MKRIGRGNKSAFTLIEIIVSLSILGIIMAIAIPMFINGNKTRDLSAARDVIQSAFNYARSAAVSSSSAGSVGLPPPKNQSTGQNEIAVWVSVTGAKPAVITVGQTDSSNKVTVLKSFQAPNGVGLSAIDQTAAVVPLTGTSANPTFIYGGTGTIVTVNGAAPNAANSGSRYYWFTLKDTDGSGKDLTSPIFLRLDALSGNSQEFAAGSTPQ